MLVRNLEKLYTTVGIDKIPILELACDDIEIANLCVKYGDCRFLENASDEVFMEFVKKMCNDEIHFNNELKSLGDFFNTNKENENLWNRFIDCYFDMKLNATMVSNDYSFLNELDKDALVRNFEKLYTTVGIDKIPILELACEDIEIANLCVKYGDCRFLENASDEVFMEFVKKMCKSDPNFQTENDNLREFFRANKENEYLLNRYRDCYFDFILEDAKITNDYSFLNVLNRDILLRYIEKVYMTVDIDKIPILNLACVDIEIAKKCVKYGDCRFLENASVEVFMEFVNLVNTYDISRGMVSILDHGVVNNLKTYISTNEHLQTKYDDYLFYIELNNAIATDNWRLLSYFDKNIILRNLDQIYATNTIDKLPVIKLAYDDIDIAKKCAENGDCRFLENASDKVFMDFVKNSFYKQENLSKSSINFLRAVGTNENLQNRFDDCRFDILIILASETGDYGFLNTLNNNILSRNIEKLVEVFHSESVNENSDEFNSLLDRLIRTKIQDYTQYRVLPAIFDYFGDLIGGDSIINDKLSYAATNIHGYIYDSSIPDALGYNSRGGSYIKITSNNVNNLESSFNTIVHEVLHGISRPYISKEGALFSKVTGFAKTVQLTGFNESVTQYFATRISDKKIERCGYAGGAFAVKEILEMGIEGFDIESLKKAYLNNDVEAIRKVVDNVCGEGYFDKKFVPIFASEYDKSYISRKLNEVLLDLKYGMYKK